MLRLDKRKLLNGKRKYMKDSLDIKSKYNRSKMKLGKKKIAKLIKQLKALGKNNLEGLWQQVNNQKLILIKTPQEGL